MVVILTKVDLLPQGGIVGDRGNTHYQNNHNHSNDNNMIHNISILIQKLYSELSIMGNSDILPFTTKGIES